MILIQDQWLKHTDKTSETTEGSQQHVYRNHGNIVPEACTAAQMFEARLCDSYALFVDARVNVCVRVFQRLAAQIILIFSVTDVEARWGCGDGEEGGGGGRGGASG